MVLSKLRNYPNLWNALAGSAIFALADVSQQKIEGRHVVDTHSTGRNAVVGSVFGPLSHMWHTRLETYLPGKARVVVLKKVLLTSTITGAVFNFLFYTLHSVLEGQEDIFAEVKEKWPKTYLTAWCFWPFFNYANMMYVSPHLRGVSGNSFAYVWTVILCFLKRQPLKNTQLSKSEQDGSSL